MKNSEIIENFVMGNASKIVNSGKTLHTEAFVNKTGLRIVLFSYQTPIAVRGAGACGRTIFIIGDKKYSATTSIHQKYLKDAVLATNYDMIYADADGFRAYLKENGVPTGRL